MNHPAWLKVVCIGCIVLGSLGLLTGLIGIAGQLFNASVQSSMEKFMGAMQQGAPNKTLEIQRKMQAEIGAVQQRYLVMNLILLGVQLFVAALLLVGGIQALRMKPVGHKLLIAAMSAAVVFELVRLPPTIIMQWESSKIMQPFMDEMMAGSGPQGGGMTPAQKRTFQTIMRSSMMFGVLFGVAMALGMAAVKIAFYGCGIWILRKPHIRDRYAGVLAPAEVVA